jgi:hypothetical protein
MTARAQQKRAARSRRNKAYKPRLISIPVTGLRHEFALVLHSGLTAAELGYFSRDQYDRIGQAINCLYGALVLRPPRDSAVLTVIEGAMRAMNDCGRRGDASGVWALRPLEQAALLAGIKVAEEHLPKMNVITLYDSMQRLKAMPPIPMPDAKQAFLASRPTRLGYLSRSLWQDFCTTHRNTSWATSPARSSSCCLNTKPSSGA